MSDLKINRDTEIRRLAKVTNLPETELTFLNKLDGSELMKLRGQLNTKLLKEFEPTFKKLASGGGLLPESMIAKLCMKFFGPRLTANTAYYTPAERSTKMGKKFTPEFLAAVAQELIPEFAEPLLRDQPVELMRPCTMIMLEKRDYYTMGSFVDFTPFEKLLALMNDINDPLASLKICSFCQRKDRMAQLVEHFSDEQVREFIITGHANPELLPEIMNIAANMTDDEKLRQKGITEALGDDYVERSRKQMVALGLETELGSLFD